MSDEPKIVSTNCNNCGGERNAFVRASHTIREDEDGIYWITTMDILECCGCSELSMRSTELFSESDDRDIKYWPPKQSRQPDWHGRLLDDNLRKAMREVYVALNQGLVMLASIGVRTLLDRSFFLLLKEDHGAFANKLKVMVEKGFLLENEKKIFQSIADVGNAAAHRAHLPTQETLTKILTAAESFLYQKFILPGDAKAMEKDTPSRKSQAGQADWRDEDIER